MCDFVTGIKACVDPALQPLFYDDASRRIVTGPTGGCFKIEKFATTGAASTAVQSVLVFHPKQTSGSHPFAVSRTGCATLTGGSLRHNVPRCRGVAVEENTL